MIAGSGSKELWRSAHRIEHGGFQIFCEGFVAVRFQQITNHGDGGVGVLGVGVWREDQFGFVQALRP